MVIAVKKVSKQILPILFILFTLLLFVFATTNINAAKTGLSVWISNIVPSLLPFFIATELLAYTPLATSLGKFLEKFMRPIFNVPGIGSYAFIMGIISGYPVGAKIVTNLYSNNLCTKHEAERLLTFTNNSGPLFIIGTVGISMFGNFTIGILLFVCHILACLCVGIIFRFYKYNKREISNIDSMNLTSSLSFNNLGSIIASAIYNSVQSVVLIGGFIVLFSVIISMISRSNIFLFINFIFTPILNIFNITPEIITPIFTGIVELTNGLITLSSIHIKDISILYYCASFLLGFGGISILLQVLSITSKTDISIKPYIFGKILQGIIATIFTFLAINIFPFFNMNLPM